MVVYEVSEVSSPIRKLSKFSCNHQIHFEYYILAKLRSFHSMSDVGVLESWMSCGLMGAQNSTVRYSDFTVVSAFIHNDDAVVQLQVNATA